MKNWRWILCSSVLWDNVKNLGACMSQALLGIDHINLFVGKAAHMCTLGVFFFSFFLMLGLSVLMALLLLPYRLVTVWLLPIFKKMICVWTTKDPGNRFRPHSSSSALTLLFLMLRTSWSGTRKGQRCFAHKQLRASISANVWVLCKRAATRRSNCTSTEVLER